MQILKLDFFKLLISQQHKGPVYERYVGSRPAGLANGRAQADKALVAGGAPHGVARVSAHADHGVVG